MPAPRSCSSRAVSWLILGALFLSFVSLAKGKCDQEFADLDAESRAAIRETHRRQTTGDYLYNRTLMGAIDLNSPLLLDEIRKQGKGSRILDVGCGEGQTDKDILQNQYYAYQGQPGNFQLVTRALRPAGAESPIIVGLNTESRAKLDVADALKKPPLSRSFKFLPKTPVETITTKSIGGKVNLLLDSYSAGLYGPQIDRVFQAEGNVMETGAKGFWALGEEGIVIRRRDGSPVSLKEYLGMIKGFKLLDYGTSEHGQIDGMTSVYFAMERTKGAIRAPKLKLVKETQSDSPPYRTYVLED